MATQAMPNAGSRDARAHDAGGRRAHEPALPVRTADLEPYTGLRYLSKLFRLIALILLLMLVAEVVAGLARQGTEAIPTLVSEVSRLIVLAGLLWGVGDVAILLVDVGHDVRAVRILMGRQTAHLAHHPHEHVVVPEPSVHADLDAPTDDATVATPPGDRRS
jgi:hypothetical protein